MLYKTATSEDIKQKLIKEYSIEDNIELKSKTKSELWKLLKECSENSYMATPSTALNYNEEDENKNENGYSTALNHNKAEIYPYSTSTNEEDENKNEAEIYPHQTDVKSKESYNFTPWKSKEDDISFGDGDDTGDFDIENEEEKERKEQIPSEPRVGDPNWHEFVMSQFTKEEIYNGNPTVDGLRRLVEVLIAPIRNMTTVVRQVPDLSNEKRATVIVNIELENNSRFSGAADSYYGNTPQIVRNCPTAMAETRAEGRALKRALRLRKVNAAEEMGEGIEDPLLTNVEDGNITQQQLQFLDMMCNKSRLDINICELIKHMGFDKDVKELTHSDALQVNLQLSKYQNQAEEIPKEIVGYEGNWK